jgi:hypothetical protein
MHTISFVPCGIFTDVRTATLPSQAIDTSLLLAELIADYLIDREAFIARLLPRKAPSAWISADRLAVLSGVPAEKEEEMETAATGRTHHPSSS